MRIHAIQTGLVQIKESQIEGRGHGLARQMAPFFDRNWSAWLPTYAWAIEHPDGVILVDTGSAATLKRLPKWHPYFRYAVHFDIEPEQEAGPQLRALGISPRDVRRVVLTHMHIDHDAGLGYFPNSEMLASAGEIARASGLAGRIRVTCRSAGPIGSIRNRSILRPNPTVHSGGAASSRRAAT
jgi:glyoxylase-like metal-dependent hydrolase (beta-lactamase superfamily II)